MNIMVKAKPFALPPLPYGQGALAPVISERTMSFHYGHHHKTYVDKLNGLIAGTPFADEKLDDIVKKAYRDESASKIFNNAAQAWNHAFFWACLTPHRGRPEGQLAHALEHDLGGHAKFKGAFVKAGADHFGSGWVWLTWHEGKLAIETTHDGVTPMAAGKTCVLAIDLWEHAYYLDYQDRRAEFLTAVAENLLNWDFARQNFERSG